MMCPPDLEPIPIVWFTGAGRFQYEETDTRVLAVHDVTVDDARTWISYGFAVFHNPTDMRRRMTYRRRVSIDLVDITSTTGWSKVCVEDDQVVLTWSTVLEPDSMQRATLTAKLRRRG